MNINIYIDDELYKIITSYSEEHHISRSSLIRSALKEWVSSRSKSVWRESFFDFEPLNSSPLKEALRLGFSEPKEDPFV